MQHKPHETAPGSSRDEAGASIPVQGVARRRLLRAGASAAPPVLLTLASGRVSAAYSSCTVASSFVSVATFASRNPTATAQCSTKTCESWKTECSGGSYKSYLDATTVTGLFGACSPASSFSNSSLSTVLKHINGIELNTELGVLQHLISLCMNVKTGNASLPGNCTQAYIGDVWKNYKANGQRYKLPSSGIDWDSSKVVIWVRMLVYPSA
ncbi:MAG: hypothetical protein WAQ05_20425 [Rubrivivax sp.]